MPDIDVNKLGDYGIIKDLDADHLPPNAWTDGENVRFRHGHVARIPGEQVVYDGASVAPYWVLPIQTASTLQLLYGGLTAAASFDGTSHTTRTRSVGGAYSASADLLWNGGVFNGIPIINNGSDVPQFWATIGSGTLADLTNWPSTHRAQILVPFGSFMVALNLTISSVEYPHRVLWSHSADPGTIPSSWDITDATKDAGERDVTDVNSGIIVGAKELAGQLFIYKGQAVWSMRYIGGQEIFGFRQVFNSFGAINNHCIVEVPRTTGRGRSTGRPPEHFVATGDDLVIHDGTSVRSIIDKKWQQYLQTALDGDNWNRSFVVTNSKEDEIWFCFPEQGQSSCSRVIIWNYEDDTISTRELPGFSYGIETFIDDEGNIGQAWADDSDSWNTDGTIWNDSVFNANTRGVLMCAPAATDFVQVDATSQFQGNDYSSYVERSGIALIGYDRQGQPQIDYNSIKLVTRVWPKVVSDASVTVKVLAQEGPESPIVYSAGFTFTPGIGQRFVDIDPPLAGRLLGIRFESNSGTSWELHGYKYDIELLGEF